MHRVLVSRIDPPLHLTTLRAKGHMTEIRVGDLRFSRKETADFLQQMLKTPQQLIKPAPDRLILIVHNKLL